MKEIPFRGDSMELKKSKTYEILDIINWSEAGELNINPKYQRNPVWDNTAKSFLIDTILRDYPMPPLFYRQIFYLHERKTKREVIDGQQRTRAIIGYYNNEFPLLKKHNSEYGGMYFKNLPPDVQEKYLKYNVFVDTISEKDDSIIYDIFARMNSNAANINKQEIRNAKFWGDFKTAVYTTASLVREDFIRYGTFTAKGFSRMQDMEFISSLYILAISGCTTESAAQIDKYYKEYDNGFESVETITNHIINAFQFIEDISQYVEDIFVLKNKNYMYDLIGYYFVGNSIISLGETTFTAVIPSLDTIAEKLNYLHFVLEDIKKKSFDRTSVAPEIIDYERNHKVHSNSKESREARIEFLINLLK